MKVLVTGGAGYIGSHTCKELARQGHTVLVYDNLSTGHRDLVRWGDFHYGDILDTQNLRNCLAKHKPDGVIHFAAHSCVGESVQDPGKYYHNNVSGTLSILEAMRYEEISNLVVSGTCAVYGQVERIPITEDTPTNPTSPYGSSKLFMERMLADFQVAHGLKWASLRYFNAAGCDADGETGERHDPETHLIPRALMAATGDIEMLNLFGDDYPTPDGTCVRDYIHVRDLATAHVAALQYLASGGESLPVNLGSGNGFSVREIIDTIHKVIDKPVPYRMSARRPGDPPKLLADSALAAKLLGWTPQHSSIDFIIETAWRWHNKDKGK